MAGILDSKTRIMDVIITQEGRRQMASGKLRPEFISFTDRQAFYEESLVSGSTDASKRIYFEATSRVEDMITLETDDSGNLIGFDSDPRVTLSGNKIFTTTGSVATDPEGYQFRFVNTGSSFASVANLIATSSINNFKNQYMIGTVEDEENSIGDGFEIENASLTFNITNSSPFDRGPQDKIVNIDSIEPIFLDKRLSHLPNFRFLPPETNTGEILGDYRNLNQKEPIDYNELIEEIGRVFVQDTTNILDPLNTERRQDMLADNFTDESVRLAKPRQSIRFKQTSQQSNIIAQIYELNTDNSSFTKLDIVDFGTFFDEKDSIRPEKHVFFVGKVYIDSNAMPTFVNLFTIIMD